MGKCVDLLAADINAASLPDYKKTHSVCGKGAMAPDPKQHNTLYVHVASYSYLTKDIFEAMHLRLFPNIALVCYYS